MSDAVVQVDGLRKVYPIFRTPLDLVRRHRAGGSRAVVALDRLSFRVEPGEVVGVVGANGAGKSTLLRVLAGIAFPTEGHVRTEGHVHALLDLNAGLNPFVSGRANIVNRLALMGLSRRGLGEAVEEITAFAELDHVIDESIRTYSTGMRMRLAFAIATAYRPDVLLLDEVLAVGDEFFADKSFRRIRELTESGHATIVASHDLTQTFRLCSRVLWLDDGRVRAEGRPEDILYDYVAYLNAYTVTGEVEIESVRITRADGREAREVAPGEAVTVRFACRANRPAPPFAIVCGWMDARTGESVLSSWSVDDDFVVELDGARREVEIAYPALPLAPGDYDFTLFLADAAQGAFPVEHYAMWGPQAGDDGRIRVLGPRDGGLLRLEPRWSVEAAG